MSNVTSYANMAFASDGKAANEAYKSAKYALERAIAENVSQDIIDMLREELDSALEECESIYRTCEREAREHYD